MILNDFCKIGKSKPAFTFENSSVFKNSDPPIFMKCEKKIINDEIEYLKISLYQNSILNKLYLRKKLKQLISQ